jgi:hypothetical protein
MPAVRAVLRCLRPWRYASGLLFGFLFGVGWFVSLSAAMGRTDWSHAIGGAVCFAVPWMLFWGLSGLVCEVFPNYWATCATTLAVVCGHVWSLTEGSLGGWQFIAIPFSTAVALFPCHWLFVLIAAVRFRVE